LLGGLSTAGVAKLLNLLNAGGSNSRSLGLAASGGAIYGGLTGAGLGGIIGRALMAHRGAKSYNNKLEAKRDFQKAVSGGARVNVYNGRTEDREEERETEKAAGQLLLAGTRAARAAAPSLFSRLGGLYNQASSWTGKKILQGAGKVQAPFSRMTGYYPSARTVDLLMNPKMPRLLGDTVFTGAGLLGANSAISAIADNSRNQKPQTPSKSLIRLGPGGRMLPDGTVEKSLPGPTPNKSLIMLGPGGRMRPDGTVERGDDYKPAPITAAQPSGASISDIIKALNLPTVSGEIPAQSPITTAMNRGLDAGRSLAATGGSAYPIIRQMMESRALEQGAAQARNNQMQRMRLANMQAMNL
jgi:hypothetical protein